MHCSLGFRKKFAKRLDLSPGIGRIGGYEVRRIQEVGELRNALQQLMRIRKDRLEVMGIDFDKVKSSYIAFS
jgi:hypothetical protein